MQLIRRSALRVASSPSCFVSKSRSINTSTPFALRCKAQSPISSLVSRRFASDDSNSPESTDSEQQSIKSAVESATESASTYASDASETLVNKAEEAKESVSDAVGSAAAYAFGASSGRPADRNGSANDAFNRKLEPTPSIYVGNLLFDVTDADLKREFAPFGEVKSANVAVDARGLSKGFGYVEFDNIDQATAAIEGKHQTVLEGRRLIVNYVARTVRTSKINPPSKTLFIGNLAFEMSDADLNKLFREIRNVIDVRVAIDRRTGQPRGFAHADFVDVDSAIKGMEALQGREIYGRVLRVDYSTPASGRR